MGLLDLSESYKSNLKKKLKDETTFDNFDFKFSNQYDLPFLIKDDCQDVLIVGAGAGNDAAGALRFKVKNIDAVEIDPKIIELGQKYHPEKPYSSPKVKVFINDGRSFFKKNKKKYDLIIMGLADSHTLGSALTNIQLDNYLYTKESMGEIKNILKPDGLLFLSFDVRRPWIGAKIQKTMTSVFDHQPLIFSLQEEQSFFGWGGVIFVQDRTGKLINSYLDKNKDLADFIKKRELTYELDVDTLSDNWPYLYLDKPRIPKVHLLISMMLILLFSLMAKLIVFEEDFYWQSFFLGAGFLLYEFQNISKATLLYGNTWMTSLFMITAVLIFILLANLVYAKTLISNKLSYLLLFGFFLLEITVPLSSFNLLASNMKIVLAPLFLNLPLFFSSLIFISYFSRTKNKKAFFASNLIGSAIGGILSFLSYRYGVSSLLLVSFLFYVLSSFSFSIKIE